MDATNPPAGTLPAGPPAPPGGATAGGGSGGPGATAGTGGTGDAGGGTGDTGGTGGADGTGGWTGAPGAYAAGSRRPQPRRSTTDRWLTGAAAGLAHHFGVEPLLVRGLFVVLTFTGGIGIPLYLAAWAVMPEEGSDRAIGEDVVDWFRRSPSWVPILLVVLGGMVLLGEFAAWDHPVLWGLLLIGAGVWLYRRSDAPLPPPPPPAGPPGTGAQPAGGPAGLAAAGVTPTGPVPGRRVAGEAGAAAATAAEQFGTSARSAPRRPSRPRSPLGRLTVAAALVAVGVVAMLATAGAVTVGPERYPAIALTVVGAGLLVGAVAGRARGLVFLGLLLVPVTVAASFVDLPLAGGVGQRWFRPGTAAEAAGGYHLLFGEMHIDLSGMTWTGTADVDATLVAGELTVTVPDDVRVDVTSHVSGGRIELFGVTRHGNDVDFATVRERDAAPRLELELRSTFGEIVVRSSGTPAAGADEEGLRVPPAPATPPAEPSAPAAPLPAPPAPAAPALPGSWPFEGALP